MLKHKNKSKSRDKKQLNQQTRGTWKLTILKKRLQKYFVFQKHTWLYSFKIPIHIFSCELQTPISYETSWPHVYTYCIHTCLLLPTLPYLVTFEVEPIR